jgi:pyochelin synthetase
MIPSHIHWHRELPLTRNGKLDRTRLAATPAPDVGATQDVEPADDVEHEIAALWADVLRTERVPVTEPLTALGGDSLAAAKILAGVRKRYGVTIPLHRLPEVRTVRAMAVRVTELIDGRAVAS